MRCKLIAFVSCALVCLLVLSLGISPFGTSKPPEEKGESSYGEEPPVVHTEQLDRGLPRTCVKDNHTWVVPITTLAQARDFCARFSEDPWETESRPRVFYGIMFGYEFDMLEVALHEIFPIVDHIFLTESTITHSLKHKPLFFDSIKHERYEQFLPKITNLVFTPSRKYGSGWDIEKRQRGFFLSKLVQMNLSKPGDVVVANIDLDEIFSRTILQRFKFCKVKNHHFNVFHFRYHLNCIQELSYSTYFTTVFTWPSNIRDLRKIDLYKRRTHRKNFPFEHNNFNDVLENVSGTLCWHLTAFGGVEAVFKKYENSPHRFVGDLSKKEIARNIEQCLFNGEKRFAVLPKSLELLPYFIGHNLCYFHQRGWIPLPPQ